MKQTLTYIFFSCMSFMGLGQKGTFLWLEDHLTGKVQVEGVQPKEYSISQRMKQYKVPGVSIAIIQSGQLVYTKGFGMADKRYKTKMTNSTLLQAASISKPLAAVAALKLVEQGKIDLDTDVNTYLKSWKVPENKFTVTEKVTLRRLLSHTAGVTVHGFPGYNVKDSLPPTAMILNGKGNTPAVIVDTVPGSIWRYSGGGYTIVQQLIEDVTGKPMGEFMDYNILPGMVMVKSTCQQPISGEKLKLASAAYDVNGKLYDGGWHNYPEVAAAGLWTTPSDLAYFCLFMQRIYLGQEKEGILSQSTVKEMLTPSLIDYGLGLAVMQGGDSLVFGHNGKNAGFTCLMLARAERGDAIVVMTNGDNGNLIIEEIVRKFSDHYRWNIRKPLVIKPVQMDKKSLVKFTGKYAFEMGGKTLYVEAKLKHGKLVLYDPDTPKPIQLTALSEREFIDIEKNISIGFEINESDEVVNMLWDKQWLLIKAE